MQLYELRELLTLMHMCRVWAFGCSFQFLYKRVEQYSGGSFNNSSSFLLKEMK